MPRDPSIKAARPTVRLKNPDYEYKETQEADDYDASGGKPNELLDDDRWLDKQSRQRTQASPHSVQILGTGFVAKGATIRDQDLWDPRPSTLQQTFSIRFLSHPHMVFKLVARACESEKSKLGDMASEYREDLGMSSWRRITLRSRIKGVYVGVSAVTCLPVVLRRLSQQGERSLDTDDLNESHDLEVDGNGRTDTRDIIWLENMLIPGNIAHLKSALAKQLCDHMKERFLQIMKRENKLLNAGLNPAGVANTLPSNESTERKPAIRRLTHDGQEYDDLHFKLRWPPMAALEFPQEMINAMEHFLSKHPHDNVPMNIALAATIIYMDLAEGGWLSEGFAGRPNAPLEIRPPPLGQFVLYFPHMLRYVETKHLTQFIHPGRFAAGHYIKDGKNKNGIKISSTLIDLKKMRLWYSQVRCRYPQVSKSHRFRLIPASMPGTHMVFPEDCTNAEPPSIDLFRMCCLNDIRTLGLPSYHNSFSYDDDEDGGVFRYIAGPDWLFSKYLQPSTHSIQGPLATDYWRPKSDTQFMALTGQARNINVLFPDISSDYYTDNKDLTEFVERYFGDVAYFTHDYDYCEHNSEYAREKRSARAKELYRVAAHLEIPVDEIWHCPNTACPAWDGMEAQLQQLKEQGLLRAITTGEDEPERVAKRPKISEPTLSAATKVRFRTLMGSAIAFSRDWDTLIVCLESDEPTIREVRGLVSKIHPFIVSVEEFLRANTSNGQGNLGEILTLAYKAVGLDPQLALTRHEENSTSEKNAFSQFGQSIEQAIKDISILKSVKDGFRFARPSIEVLAQSPLIQDQIRIYKEIDALLKEIEKA